MTRQHFVLIAALCYSSVGFAQADSTSAKMPRCEVVPIAEQRVSFQIDGIEKFQWNFSQEYPRPFFFPFLGPSGAMLTRMGHPGAPDHDHHQSIWFANNKVNGLDFWANNKNTSIRQRQWLAYVDGKDEAIMACLLDWLSSDGSAVVEQELVAAILPMSDEEYALEIQCTFRPANSEGEVEFEKTNFAFLAVRVAKSLSAHFGGGKLSNSEGVVGEKEIFGKSAKWMDYSGPVSSGKGSNRKTIIEGITFFDHPSNRSYPTPWHVRDDGWMGAAVNSEQGTTIRQDSPLMLRYLLLSHHGPYDAIKSQAVHEDFAKRSPFTVSKSVRSHLHYDVKRQAK